MDIPQIPNLIYYAIPFFIVTVIIESIVLYKKQPTSYNLKDTLASIIMGIGNVLVNLLSKLLVVLVISFLYENFRITTIPFVWWAWIMILAT